MRHFYQERLMRGGILWAYAWLLLALCWGCAASAQQRRGGVPDDTVQGVPLDANLHRSLRAVFLLSAGEYEKAVSLMEAMVSEEDYTFSAMLAKCYLQGQGVAVDTARALHLLEMGTLQQDESSQVELGKLLVAMGKGRREEGLAYLNAAMRSGSGSAAVALSAMYVKENEWDKGAAMLYKAMQLGHREAPFQLAVMLETMFDLASYADTAVACLRVGASRGDGRACYSLGLSYEAGYRVPRSYVEAQRWYEQVCYFQSEELCRKAKARALHCENVLKQYGSDTDAASAIKPVNYHSMLYGADFLSALGAYAEMEGRDEDARYFYRTAVGMGHTASSIPLSLVGVGRFVRERKSEQDAIRAAAMGGNAQAQRQVGEWYHRGALGIDPDAVEAARWFRIAAHGGDSLAQYYMGLYYSKGLGGLALNMLNMLEAVKWYSRAAAQGHGPSQYEMGKCYEEGLGVKKDYGLAMEWYAKAAANGVEDAAHRRNACLSKSAPRLAKTKGSTQAAVQKKVNASRSEGGKSGDALYEQALRASDESQRVSMMREAAEAGNASAQSQLGQWYHFGVYSLVGGQSVALQWFRKAAAQGDAKAQYWLGNYYESGHGGLNMDKGKAKEWYRRAAARGHAGAKRKLQELD